jgi:hypothetical protein
MALNRRSLRRPVDVVVDNGDDVAVTAATTTSTRDEISGIDGGSDRDRDRDKDRDRDSGGILSTAALLTSSHGLDASQLVHELRKQATYPLVFSAETWTERDSHRAEKDLFPVFHKTVLTVSRSPSPSRPDSTSKRQQGSARDYQLTSQLFDAKELPMVRSFVENDHHNDQRQQLADCSPQAVEELYRRTLRRRRRRRQVDDEHRRSRQRGNLSLLRGSKTLSSLLSSSLPLLATSVATAAAEDDDDIDNEV